VKRTLSLKRDVLAALSDDELAGVVAGQIPPTTPVFECLPSRYVPCTVATG
jgi:hypothetical protein